MAIVNGSIATQAEAEVGTLTRIRNWTPQRIWQAIRNLARLGVSTGLTYSSSELDANATIVDNLSRARWRIHQAQATAESANNNANSREPAFHILSIHRGGSGSTDAAFGGNRGNISLLGRAGQIEVFTEGDNAAAITFHRIGQFGVNFGVDNDNQLRCGGWSMGETRHLIWHEGNFSRPTAENAPGRWFHQTPAEGAALIMPSGGIWACFAYLFTMSGNFSGQIGRVAPGGTQIAAGVANRIWRPMFWRIV